MRDNKNGNWFARHKVLTVILAVILLFVVIGIVTSGGDSNQPNSSNQNSQGGATEYRFADRADKQPEDVEVLPGETVDIGGLEMTLSDVSYTANLSDFDKAQNGKTFMVANVTLKNNSGDTKPYNYYDFRIQTSGGQVLDPTIVTIDTLGSGDLVNGGTVEGKIVFELPKEDGHQYVIWKPGAFDAARGVVQVQ
jgi:hypothetical protein